ncbi:MAG: hypothetical protein ACOCUS_02080 [Polyangiales bacterium]
MPSRTTGVVGAVTISMRDQLARGGRWPTVRAALERRAPAAGDEVEAVRRWSVVDVGTHVALLESMGEVLGESGVRDFGRERLTGEVSEGLFSTIARSWLRSFRARPEELLRMAPHLWRTAMRNCGTIRVVDVQDGYVRGRFEGLPSQLFDCRPWRWLMEGMGEGILELVELLGTCRTQEEGDALDLVVKW